MPGKEIMICNDSLIKKAQKYHKAVKKVYGPCCAYVPLKGIANLILIINKTDLSKSL